MRNKLALVIAIVLGLIAVYGVHQYLARERKQYEQKFRSILVVAASQRIKAGEVIRPKMLAVKPISEAGVLADHILKRERDRLIGQTINRSVERGEPLLSSYFRRPVERLHDKLNPGERALSLRVDLISGVAGNIVPGSHVDILGTFPVSRRTARAAQSGSGATESLTVVMLSDVRVMAVDNRTREMEYVTTGSVRRRTSYGSVTVAVTPEEASVLVYAQQYGELVLTLRCPADTQVGPVPAEIHDKNLLQRAARAQSAREERLKNRSPITVEPLPPE